MFAVRKFLAATQSWRLWKVDSDIRYQNLVHNFQKWPWCSDTSVDTLGHAVSRSFSLFVIYWEVRLKQPDIALSLALHWLPGNGRDRLVFVLWACSCSARRWLDLPGPGFVAIHRPAQMPRVQAPHYITLHWWLRHHKIK